MGRSNWIGWIENKNDMNFGERDAGVVEALKGGSEDGH